MPLASYSQSNLLDRPAFPRSTKPVETGFPEIDSLDFAPIRFTLKRTAGACFSERELDLREDHFRAFLALHKHAPHLSFAPSEFIDEFWHAALEDTAFYREMCQKVLGEPLDHFPYAGVRNEADGEALDAAFARTQTHMAEHFPMLESAGKPATCLTVRAINSTNEQTSVSHCPATPEAMLTGQFGQPSNCI